MDFYPNARKKNCGHYKKSAMSSLRFGLRIHFMLKRGMDIIADPAFKKSNQVFEAVVVDLKRKGVAKVDHHKQILKEDLAKIYSSYNPSNPNPKALQHFVSSCFVLFVCVSVSTEQDENTAIDQYLDEL